MRGADEPLFTGCFDGVAEDDVPEAGFDGRLAELLLPSLPAFDDCVGFSGFLRGFWASSERQAKQHKSSINNIFLYISFIF